MANYQQSMGSYLPVSPGLPGSCTSGSVRPFAPNYMCITGRAVVISPSAAHVLEMPWLWPSTTPLARSPITHNTLCPSRHASANPYIGHATCHWLTGHRAYRRGGGGGWGWRGGLCMWLRVICAAPAQAQPLTPTSRHEHLA
jgi:hypothetical protein